MGGGGCVRTHRTPPAYAPVLFHHKNVLLVSVEDGAALVFYVKHKNKLKQKVKIKQDTIQFTLNHKRGNTLN